MSKIKLRVNQETFELEVADDMPLLWALRDTIGLTGTKYGCGIGQCGACTVHINGNPVRSCLMKAIDAEGQDITTIEGLAVGGELDVLQQVWIDQDVAQCGYCQAGQIMSAAALLASNKKPSDGEIDNAMSGNYCRCGTYIRIREAIHTASEFYDASRGGAS
jgi:isoquinoline 1-oxidoreductase alpha subunit